METLVAALALAACPVGMAAIVGGSWLLGRRAGARSVRRWRPATRAHDVIGGREAVQTFVIADLVGYTALTEAYGDEHAAELAGRFRRAVQRLLPRYDAREVKALGDGVLLRVPEAADSLRLAVRIAEEIGGQDGIPLVRVGIHTGSAVERDGDWFGGSVNTAARVVALAEGGQVLLSGATRAGAGELPDIEFRAVGERRLKNLSKPVTVYRAMRNRKAQPPTDAHEAVVREPVVAGGVR